MTGRSDADAASSDGASNERPRVGNRFVVRFDADEFGLWHDDDGDPVLSLSEKDLILIDDA